MGKSCSMISVFRIPGEPHPGSLSMKVACLTYIAEGWQGESQPPEYDILFASTHALEFSV